MKFNNKILGFVAVGVLATGALVAQVVNGPMRHGFGMTGGFHHRGAFLGMYLDLTDAQKAQAKTIFSDARTEALPIFNELKQGHESMAAAIKARKSDSELQTISTSQGTRMGQLAFVHAKAFSKFWAILTPEQQAKADKLHNMIKERIESHLAARE